MINEEICKSFVVQEDTGLNETQEERKSTKSRTATGMDGKLTLIFRKSETSRNITKYF